MQHVAFEAAGETFRLGNYRHYKGGMYTALFVAAHHETRRPMVVYVCHETGGLNVRPLRKIAFGSSERLEDELDNDAWTDWVECEGKRVQRFAYLGRGW